MSLLQGRPRLPQELDSALVRDRRVITFCLRPEAALQVPDPRLGDLFEGACRSRAEPVGEQRAEAVPTDLTLGLTPDLQVPAKKSPVSKTVLAGVVRRDTPARNNRGELGG